MSSGQSLCIALVVAGLPPSFGAVGFLAGSSDIGQSDFSYSEPSAPCQGDDTKIPPGGHLAGMFRCRAGWCISTRGVCNGVKNCGDGSDELGCSTTTTTIYAESSVQCQGNDKNISPGSRMGGMFRCHGGWCISARGVCNGVKNCGDGSDELDCNTTKTCYDEVRKSLVEATASLRRQLQSKDSDLSGSTTHWFTSGREMFFLLRNWTSPKLLSKTHGHEQHLAELVKQLLLRCGNENSKDQATLVEEFRNRGGGAMYFDRDAACWRARYSSRSVTWSVTNGARCALTADTGLDAEESCSGVESVRNIAFNERGGKLDVYYCKNWREKIVERPIALGGQFPVSRAVRSDARTQVQYKLGMVIVSIQGKVHPKVSSEAFSWMRQKLNNVLASRGLKFKLDFNKVSVWGFSARGKEQSWTALLGSQEFREAVKGVIAFGGWATPGWWNVRIRTPQPWMPGIFSLWCNDKDSPRPPKLPRHGNNMEWVQAGSPVITHFEYSDCHHGQYNRHANEWLPQLKVFFQKVFA